MDRRSPALIPAADPRATRLTRPGRAATVGLVVAADWDDVKRIVAEALAIDGGARSAFVEQACAGRDDLRAEVLSLLAAQARVGGFLETRGRPSLFSALAEDALVGTRLGPYEIQGPLGRGGMGVVYRARRESPAREVALKVVRLEADSDAVLRRFAAEGQILARLDHPYVARLLDAGVTPDGRPYFVMELVEGMPVHRHCGAAGLDLRQRLELFVKICEAVAYAHGRLIVHRDIKPSNIMVNAGGDPKLLDFGISRLLDDGLLGQVTETGLLLMTPEYASPEQVRGELTTVATDVHGLGLLLHVLLTGQAPLRFTTSSPEELVRRICLDDLPLPSASCAPGPDAEHGGFEPVERPEQLASLLRGDLDSITARALRKEPERRYASVEQLAQDVRRHLDGRPVLARGGRWRYRVGKFVRRNRAAVALASALILALVGGLAATAWQARVARQERARAEKRFADVRQLATSFLFEFETAVRELPGSTKARELLVTKAVTYLDDLAAEAGHDTSLQRELAAAYGKLADVQGGVGQSSLGDRAAAERSLRKAVELLAAAAPSDGEGLALLAQLYQRLGWLVSKGQRYSEALADLEQSRRLAARAAPLLPALAGAEQEAHALHVLGQVLGDSEDWKGAIERLREALACLDRLAPEDRVDPRVLNRKTLILGVLGQMLFKSEQPAAALVALQQAAELRRTALAQDPLNTSIRRALGIDQIRLSRAHLELDQTQLAGVAAQESLAIFTQRAAEDPHDFQVRIDVAHAQQALCEVRLQAGDVAAAREPCSAHLRISEAVVAQPGRAPEMQWDLIVAVERMGHLERRAGRPDLALIHYRRALALAQPPEARVGPRELASGHLDIAQALSDLHRSLEAAAEARAGVALLEKAAVASPKEALVRRELAQGHEALADLLIGVARSDPALAAEREEALQHYRAALDGFEALRQEGRLSSKLTDGLKNLAARMERTRVAAAR